MPCPHKYQDDPVERMPTPSYSVVVATFLHDSSGTLLAQHIDWPQPLKFIEPRDPEIDIALSGDQLTINVKYPVKGLVLSIPGGEDDIAWSDNGFDIVPGHPYEVKASGLNGRIIHAAHLGRDHAKPLRVKA